MTASRTMSVIHTEYGVTRKRTLRERALLKRPVRDELDLIAPLGLSRVPGVVS